MAVLLACMVALAFWPIWRRLGTHILGDPGTDAIRGMWGLDLLRRSMLPPDTPILTHQLNFPEGVHAVVLPWFSGQLISPLGWLAGPVVEWNLANVAAIWAAGLASAWLVRSLTRSWPAGLVVGAAIATQPMLTHAVADGTLEHAAFWSVPVLLGALCHLRRSWNPRWGVFAGLLAFVVATDSPYHAVYSVVLSLALLPGAGLRGAQAPGGLRAIMAGISGLLVAGALAGGLVLALFGPFDLSSTSDATQFRLWQMNATDIHTWWQFDWGPPGPRDRTLSPTTIPSLLLWGALVLSLIGGPRALPWVLAGLFSLILSFGLNARISGELAQWLGRPGKAIGEQLIHLNSYLYALPGLRSIRFPARWLIPAALAFSVGASIGLARLLGALKRGRWTVAISLALGIALSGIRTSRFLEGFPIQELPQVQFAEWIRTEGSAGGVLSLPQLRTAPPGEGMRADQLVYANLPQSLASSDLQYFQVLHQHPSVGAPSLKTLVRRPVTTAKAALLRDWDDLTQSKLMGKPIPRSAYDSPDEAGRQGTIAALHSGGLRWITVDLTAYDDQALDILRRQLGDLVAEERTFEDGDGVMVFRLR